MSFSEFNNRLVADRLALSTETSSKSTSTGCVAGQDTLTSYIALGERCANWYTRFWSLATVCLSSAPPGARTCTTMPDCDDEESSSCWNVLQSPTAMIIGHMAHIFLARFCMVSCSPKVQLLQISFMHSLKLLLSSSKLSRSSLKLSVHRRKTERKQRKIRRGTDFGSFLTYYRNYSTVV